MRRWLATAFAHRLPLLFCGGALLAGGTAVLYAEQQLGATETELAALQQQAARTAQRLAELRRAAAALDGLVVAAPAPGDALTGIAAAGGLTVEAGPERKTAAERWRISEFHLHGALLHEEILLDILDRWSTLSAFQHQVRHCALRRQAAELLADCRLALLLPAGPNP